MSQLVEIYHRQFTYHTVGGFEVSYVLNPDSSILGQIEEIYNQHIANDLNYPELAFLHPHIFQKLNEDLYSTWHFMGSQMVPVVRFDNLVLNFSAGSLKLHIMPDAYMPIFIGSFEEYKNNDFDGEFRKIVLGIK